MLSTNHTLSRLLVAAALVALAPAALANPPVARPVVQQATVQVKVSVKGMVCEDCSAKVKKAAMGVAGVKTVKVDEKANQAVVSFDPSKTKIETVLAAIKKAGFKAKIKRA